MKRSPEVRLYAAPSPPPGTPTPHNLEAERVVLSDLMCGGHVALVRDILRVEDFFASAHRLMFEAILAIDDEHVEPDDAAVAMYLHAQRKLGAHGADAAYLKEVANATPFAGNVEFHAKVVAHLGIRRQIIAECQTIAAEGYGVLEDDVSWIRRAPSRLAALADRSVRSDAVFVGRSIQDAMGPVAEKVDRKERGLPVRISGVTTGFANLDKYTGGLHRGQLTLVSGITGRGKTAFGMSLAMNAAASDPFDGQPHCGVAVFSLEMARDDIGLRLACAQALVSGEALLQGTVSRDEADRLFGATNWLSRLPMMIDDTKRLTTSALRAKARRCAAELDRRGAPLRVILVDYIQLMDGRDLVDRSANREQQLAAVSKALVEIAVEFKVSLVALAQLNKSGEIRESQAMLMDAHNWWDIEREAETPNAPRHPEIPEPVRVHIRKQRSGRSGVAADMWFHSSYVLFSDQERV
jgi:replicative DNA helicase